MVEIWTATTGLPRNAARFAARAQADGYDGLQIVDSQNLVGDCYVALALAAHATTTLRLSTGVTNPVTRHPAVTAAAIATVHVESGGRAVLGIGRGDSALAHVGLAPAPVGEMREAVRTIQALLAGRGVDTGDEFDGSRARMGNRPPVSRLEWLSADLPKVVVDVAASGPKMIGLAAVEGDRITFAVGARPERISWALDVARQARERHGLDPATLSAGAYVNCVVHDDAAVARHLGSGSVATFARFTALAGDPQGPMSDDDRQVFRRVASSYDMTAHIRPETSQTDVLTDDFADRFGAFGPPERVVAAITELVDLGLDRVVIVGPTTGPDPSQGRVAGRRFADEVLPELRQRLG